MVVGSAQTMPTVGQPPGVYVHAPPADNCTRTSAPPSSPIWRAPATRRRSPDAPRALARRRTAPGSGAPAATDHAAPESPGSARPGAGTNVRVPPRVVTEARAASPRNPTTIGSEAG